MLSPGASRLWEGHEPRDRRKDSELIDVLGPPRAQTVTDQREQLGLAAQLAQRAAAVERAEQQRQENPIRRYAGVHDSVGRVVLGEAEGPAAPTPLGEAVFRTADHLLQIGAVERPRLRHVGVPSPSTGPRFLVEDSGWRMKVVTVTAQRLGGAHDVLRMGPVRP
jgi:hypothetical protein